MIRLLPLLLPLAACGAFSDAFSLPRSGYDVPIEDLERLDASGPGSFATPLFDAYGAIPVRGRVFGDSAAAWALIHQGAGFDEQLLDVEAAGLSLHEVGLEGAVRERPVPDLTIEGPDDALDRLLFQTTTVPGLLAFVVDDTLHLLPPDAEAWQTRPLPAGTPTLTEVAPERSLIRDGLQAATLVEPDGTTWQAAIPDGVLGHAFGPFDGQFLARLSWTETELCVDRIDLDRRQIASTDCLRSDVPLGRLDNDILGGSVDAVQFVLRDATPFQNRFWYVADDRGIERLGYLPLNPTDGYGAYPDDPQLDALRVSYGKPRAHDQFWTPDGGWSWANPLDRDRLQPNLTCGCPDQALPTECRCLDRDFPIGRSVVHGVGQAWLLGAGVIDTRRFVWAQRVDNTPTTSTTADPERPLDPDWTPGDLPGPDGTPLLAMLPGNGGDEVDIGECVEVVDDLGGTPERDDRGPIFDPERTYTLTAQDCPTDDGGPPPLAVTVRFGPDVESFLFSDVVFGRGLPLDPADDPPELVGQLGAEGLLVRERSGWTALYLDADGVVQRTTVDAPGAAPPLHLRDGRRVLLEDGDVVDVETGRVISGPALSVPPLELEQLAGGRLLVEETGSRLALWDLDGDLSSLLDLTGARSADLLDASDDARVRLEEEAGRLYLRDAVGGSVDLGSTGLGLQGAWLSADGSWGLTSVQTETVGTGRNTVTAWAFAGSGGGLAARSETVCSACRGWPVHHRETGSALVLYDPGVLTLFRLDFAGDPAGTWSLERTALRNPAGISDLDSASGRTDRWGRAWWREGTSVLGYDFDDGSLTRPTAVLGDLVDAWHGPAWLVNGSDYARIGEGGVQSPWRARGSGPAPIAGGRALTSGGSPFAVRVGDWREGGAAIVDAVEVKLGGEAFASEPVQTGWPCMPIRLGPQPDQVIAASPWSCVR